jgi:PAS domain S-box-containing protein
METRHYKNSSAVCAEPASFRAGQQLSYTELKNIIDFSPAGLGIVENRILGWANDMFYTMLGYEVDSLAGKNTRMLYEDQAEYDRVGYELYSRVDRCGVGFVETKLLKKDGTLLDCRIRASKFAHGKTSDRIIVVITDISELKLLQIQLQQAQKMEAIGVLAGGISHDFNNILMGIQGHLSLMQVDISDMEKAKNHIKHIGRLVKTAAELTSRLLGFARGGKYRISTLDMNELLGMTLNIFRPTRKDIEIHEDYDNNLYPVAGDQSQLEQVFLNLMINASQAMPDHGDLFVITRNIYIDENHSYPFEITAGNYIKVTVKDTGVGMDRETQKKIFDPFFSTKEAGDNKGRGLGLSTVFGIVKNHGGFILVDSDKGKGASFHICLPASRDEEKPSEQDENSCFERMQKGSETVLLVDDEDEIVNVGKNFLEKLGYKALVARNGLEAVEVFRSYKDEIALVVLDLVMPKMNGKQACAMIKDIRRDAKILISTGYSVDEEVEKFLNSGGCSGFIQKPFSLNEFAGALRKILDNP